MAVRHPGSVAFVVAGLRRPPFILVVSIYLLTRTVKGAAEVVLRTAPAVSREARAFSATDALRPTLLLLLRPKHAPDFDPATLEMRASEAGNYLSVTATINATSRDQLDDLYRELVSHPMVKLVL